MADGNSYQTNQHVKWNWGEGTGSGQVQQRFECEVERTLQGSKVSRNGSENDPAYLIRRDDGDEVLKLGSELEAAN